jgi:hypothetical protein
MGTEESGQMRKNEESDGRGVGRAKGDGDVRLAKWAWHGGK